MATQTWADFKAELRALVWPYPGEADNLVSAHNAYFVEGMVDIQTWVEQLQAHNIDVYPFCSTFFECAKTLITAPKGKLTRVYTITNEDWCNKVDYISATWREVESWANEITEYTAPVGVPVQQGVYVAESTTDNTCGTGRARRGLWAIRNNRLLLAPYIQSNESVVVEWDGVKNTYLDGDMIDLEFWGSSEKSLVRLFVQYKHELFFGDPALAKALKQEYAEAVSDTMWEWRENTRQQLVESSILARLPTSAELDADEVGVIT